MINFIADTTLTRLRGIFFRKEQTIVISPCKDIHTFFMKRNIDVAFFEKDIAIHVIRNLKPWQRVKIKKSEYVVERFSKPKLPWYEIGDSVWEEVNDEGVPRV